jgi:hypothetical protein
MTMNEEEIVFQTPEKFSFPGIDKGNGRKPLVKVVETKDVIVVKVPGGKHWSGLGRPQAYHAACFQVFRKLSEELADGRRIVRVSRIVDIPIRRGGP